MAGTPSGTEYYAWYDRENGNFIKKELLFMDGDLTTVTEELFPTLEDGSHVFLGWYYYKYANTTTKTYLKTGDTFDASKNYYNEFYGEWEKVPNKIIYNNETLIDISQDTVTSNVLIEGYTAHDKMGWAIEGTIPNNGRISKTMDGVNTKSISIPSGYTSGGSVSLDSTINTAFTNAKNALVEKGVSVSSSAKITDLANLISSIDTGMKIETCTLKINNGTGGLKTICGIKFENDDITYFKIEDSSYNPSIIIENVLCNSVVMFEFVKSGSIHEAENCTIIHKKLGVCGAIYLNTPANGIVEILDYNQK